MKRSLNVSYGAIQGTYWMYYGVAISFASVFLLDKSYTNSEIGVIMAAASILAVALQPLLADAADRSKRISLIGITCIISIGLIAATASLYFFPEKALSLSVIFIIIAALHTSLQPLINSTAFYLCESGHEVNFGVARSSGSVAYAVFCAILGSMVTNYGTGIIPAAGVGVLLLLLLFLWVTRSFYQKCVSSRPLDRDTKDFQKEEPIRLNDFVKRNRLFILFSFGIMLVFFQNSVFNTYLLQILANVGGNSSQMGWLFSFMALLELPGFVFFSQLKKIFSCQMMLKIAAVAFLFKVFLCWIAPSVGFIFMAFLFQLISFPIFLAGSVHLVDEVMEKGEAVKGQSCVTGMITLSTVFASLLGGVILDLSGASLLLMLSTALCVMGTLIVFATVGRIRKVKAFRPICPQSRMLER